MIKEITITRKFNLGKNTFENEDISVTFDVSEEKGTVEEITEKCFQQYHTIVLNSDLPSYVLDFWQQRQSLDLKNE